MNLEFFKKTNTTSERPIGQRIFAIWEKVKNILFFVVLFAVISYSAYYWQKNIDASWSQERKQEYLDAQNKGVTFQEKDFQAVVGNIEVRKSRSQQKIQPINDIFK